MDQKKLNDQDWNELLSHTIILSTVVLWWPFISFCVVKPVITLIVYSITYSVDIQNNPIKTFFYNHILNQNVWLFKYEIKYFTKIVFCLWEELESNSLTGGISWLSVAEIFLKSSSLLVYNIILLINISITFHLYSSCEYLHKTIKCLIEQYFSYNSTPNSRYQFTSAFSYLFQSSMIDNRI